MEKAICHLRWTGWDGWSAFFDPYGTVWPKGRIPVAGFLEKRDRGEGYGMAGVDVSPPSRQGTLVVLDGAKLSTGQIRMDPRPA